MAKIIIGADHAGYELKNKIINHLSESGFDVVDKGAFEYDEEDDYPDFVIPVAQEVALDGGSVGIVIGGSGQGETITANKMAGIRAALYYGGSEEILKLSREHNNANILSLGARFLTEREALHAIDVWLGATFSGDERHVRRIGKIEQ